MDTTALAAYLRSRRDRVRPADVGLTAGPRRRVPGLRREEVAQLANLSADYYTELERGRGAQPSDRTLAALARALRLNGDERDHLFRLGDRPVPSDGHASTAHVQPALLGLLDQLTGTPAQVITDLHEVVVQNPLAVALVGRAPVARGPRSGLVYRWFTDPAARALYPREDHARHARSFVADLQAVAARRGGDGEVRRMVAELRAHSAEFAELWDTHDVAVRRTDHKRIVHPALGVIELDCHNLFSEDSRQRLLWFTAPAGSQGAEQLRLLSVIGTQDMSSGERTPPDPPPSAGGGSGGGSGVARTGQAAGDGNVGYSAPETY